MYRYFKEYRYPGSLYMKIMTSVICATNHALSWYFLRIEDTFLKKKNVVKQWVFFYHHHPPPHKPIQPFKEHKRCILTTTRYSSPTSWSRLHIKDVVVANLVPILYFTLCIYRKKKGQRGRKNHGLMYSRRGNKEKVIAIAFKISTHLASIVAYSITYIQVLEQVQFWGNSLQSCDLNIYERGYKIKGIQFLTLGHNIFSVFRNRWSKK